MMNESFLGIFDDDVSDAPPAASRQPSWAGLPSPGPPGAALGAVGREPSWAGLPASPGINIGRQPSWADTPSIADAWDSVPLPNTLHKAPSGEVDVRETVMPAEILAMPEADLLTPLWAPDPPRRVPKDPPLSDAGSEPTGEGKSSDGGEEDIPPPPKPKKPKKKKKKTTTKAKKPVPKKREEPPPVQEMRIGAVVTAPALAFGAAFASGAPEGKTYRGIVVDATDSDEAWVVRYDDDGLRFETATAFLTIVREEGGHHLRARRARALEERRRLERAKNEDKPWTPEETSELRSLVGELGASVETWPLIARRLKTGRPPVQVMSYYEALPKDLFEESDDDEPSPPKKKRGRPPKARAAAEEVRTRRLRETLM